MISCERATELLEKKKLFTLSTTEQIQFRMHRFMCTTCRAFQKSSTAIEHSLPTAMREDYEVEMTLTDEQRNRIKSVLSGQ